MWSNIAVALIFPFYVVYCACRELSHDVAVFGWEKGWWKYYPEY